MGLLKKLFGNTDEKPTKRHPIEDEVMYYIPQDNNDVALMKTTVAGVTHYVDLKEAPFAFQGRTKFEPENPYNKRAVALVTDEGRQIGYIPDRELSLYYNIFDKDGVRFYGGVGVFRNDKNKRTVYGKIMLLEIPDSDDGTLFRLAQRQLDSYMQFDVE